MVEPLELKYRRSSDSRYLGQVNHESLVQCVLLVWFQRRPQSLQVQDLLDLSGLV